MEHDDDTHSEHSEITPSPMMVGGPQVGGLSYRASYNPYVIRFTPATLEDKGQQAYEYSDVKTWLAENFDTYILTEEKSPHLHFHMFVDTKMDSDKLKKKIRDFIYPYYPNRPRGFGGSQYNCKEALDPLNAIIYALKQKGRYDWSGFESEEFIAHCQRLSFEKKSNDVQVELAELEEKFIKSEIKDPYEFATQITLVYAKHDKNINYSTLQNYINSKMIKRDPEIALSLAKKNLRF